METIKDFDQLISHLRKSGSKRRIAVVWASDPTTQNAVALALKSGFAEALFVGCAESVKGNPNFNGLGDRMGFVDADDADDAARKGVALAREGSADLIMKGMINTDNLLRAVLHREDGILPQGNVLTHVTLARIPAYDKLLMFTDAAVIPYPTDAQRAAQVRYVAGLCRSLGIAEPKISLIHCSEKVDERHFPFTADYERLRGIHHDDSFGDCIVDGPLDVKTSCSAEALRKKHIESPLGGEADALVFPDIEAGNTFYKAITLFAGAETAGMLVGAKVPVVLPSRGDSMISKYYSLAFASL